MSCERSFSEMQDLTDEGLVSSNRERFTTGKILGNLESRRRSSAETNYIDKKHIDSLTSRFEESGKSKSEVLSASNVPRKLKDASDVFHHNKDDYTDCVKQEVKVNKIDTSNIFRQERQEVIAPSNVASKVGKLKIEAANIFENQSDEEIKRSPEIKVGKLNAENLFKEEKKEEEATSIIKVGKLGKNVYNPKAEDVKESQSENIRIGKINTDNLFKESEENSEELLNIWKPGKLTEDKLTFANGNDNETLIYLNDFFYYKDEEKDVDREDDTHVVPSGKVSERTNAFESKPGKSEQKLSPVLRRSESNLTSDMQKKYQVRDCSPLGSYKSINDNK